VDGPRLLTGALIGLSFTVVVLMFAATLRKLARSASMAKRARLEAELRPQLLRVLADDEPELSGIVISGRAARKTVERLAAGLLSKLRGMDRSALVELLDEHGVIDAARRRTRRVGAVGRARAAAFLGDTSTPRALPELVALLADRDGKVRDVAARALGKLGDPEAVPMLLATLDRHRPRPIATVVMALLHIGPSVAEPLHPGLRLGSPLGRAATVELLGLMGDIPATKELLRVLADDPVLDVRVRAARALGRIGSPEAVRMLMSCIQDPIPIPLRAQAAAALGQIGATDALPALHVALASGEYEVARVAADALWSLGPPGVGVLSRAATGGGPGAPYAREALAFGDAGSTRELPDRGAASR
jgi:HEAT repeat protein